MSFNKLFSFPLTVQLFISGNDQLMLTAGPNMAAPPPAGIVPGMAPGMVPPGAQMMYPPGAAAYPPGAAYPPQY